VETLAAAGDVDAAARPLERLEAGAWRLLTALE
jgi:hypothetical protein